MSSDGDGTVGGVAPAVAGERGSFDSHGETIVGRLFPAAFGDGSAPANSSPTSA